MEDLTNTISKDLALIQTLCSQLSISSGVTKASAKSRERYLHFSKLAITSLISMKCIASISMATSMNQKPGAVDIQLADNINELTGCAGAPVRS